MGRDRFDYDTVDELLIADGALARYRVLAWNQGGVTEASALRAVGRWISEGGTLVTGAIEVETVEGDRTLWRQLMPQAAQLRVVRPGGHWDWERVAPVCVKRIGKGAVIRVPLAGHDVAAMTEVVERAANHLSQLAPGLRDGVLIDGAADQIVAVRLPDRVLYYNDTDKTIAKTVEYRPADWEKASWHPLPWRQRSDHSSSLYRVHLWNTLDFPISPRTFRHLPGCPADALAHRRPRGELSPRR